MMNFELVALAVVAIWVATAFTFAAASASRAAPPQSPCKTKHEFKVTHYNAIDIKRRYPHSLINSQTTII